MDEQRFDQLARAFAHSDGQQSFVKKLATVVSRRQAVVGLGAAFAGLVGLGDAAAAKCRRTGTICSADANCCSGRCRAVGRKRRKVCQLPPICRSGVGQCAAINEACTDLPCCSGTCAGGVCACVPLNGACADQYDCCKGTACTAGTCQTVIVGNDCDTGADCGNGTFCSGSGGQCGACVAGSAVGGGFEVGDECPWPMPGYVCIDGPYPGDRGFGYCCIPGENCEGDPCARACNVGYQGGTVICPV